MSYGWKRTEILGALTNGIFLVSLAVYITLETIPEILEPSPPPSGGVVIIIAFFGLLINTVATIVFHFTGQSHGHSHAGGGHGHSHGGGGDHGHSHGGDKEDDHGHSHSKKKKDEEVSLIEDFHSEDKKKGHGHSHGGDDHGHSHSHGEKKKEGHGHSHGGEEKEDHGHSHTHGEKKKEGHGHSHGAEKEDHGHSHAQPKPKKVVDANVKAVCLHYMGDMISSFFVLVMGVVIYFTPDAAQKKWLDYVDPVTSIFIVILILVTTLPLIKGCFLILLQRTPQHIDLQKLKGKILHVSGVLNVHDFHVWQLVDGMIITSLHINVEESTDFNHISRKIKKLLHKAGIHSSAIQPEFVNAHHQESNSCLQNCVKDCSEDWCCKEEKPKNTKKTPLKQSSGPNSKITYSQIEPL